MSFALGNAWSQTTRGRRSANSTTQNERRCRVLSAGPEIGLVGATENVRWKACSNIKSSVSSDGVFLVDQADEFCYGLDTMGAQVWITIESSPCGIASEDILDALETHFNSPRNQLADSLHFHLQRLHALGFIEKLHKP